MTDQDASSSSTEPGRASPEDPLDALPKHPTGTLAIVLAYGALFALFWAWIYFGVFLGRGAPTS